MLTGDACQDIIQTSPHDSDQPRATSRPRQDSRFGQAGPPEVRKQVQSDNRRGYNRKKVEKCFRQRPKDLRVKCYVIANTSKKGELLQFFANSR